MISVEPDHAGTQGGRCLRLNSRGDQRWAQLVANHLTHSGFTVWCDKHHCGFIIPLDAKSAQTAPILDGHPILWMLMAIALVSVFLVVALGVRKTTWLSSSKAAVGKAP
jgi:hypothetical protein